MSEKKSRQQLERSFIFAGLYRLCKVDTPSILNLPSRLKGSHQKVYRALCSSAKKMSLKELEIFSNAFDGIDETGKNLIGDVEDSNV